MAKMTMAQALVKFLDNQYVSFDGVDGEAVLMLLDLAVVAVSNGSACASGSVQNSHVISAIYPSKAKGAVRFSFSYLTTFEEIDYTVKELKTILQNLRKLSPVKKQKEVK